MPAFLLPDLGEGLTEAEIVTWHVQTGDTVAVDQPIVEVETAKAMVEVPVPFAGRVTALHGQPGDVVAVGAPLVTVDTAARLAEPGVVVAPASPDQGGPDQDTESGNVLIGYGTSSGHRRRHRAARSPVASNGRVPVASPLIRQLARNGGVDLMAIRGSGRDGLITRADVDAAISARQAGSAAAPEPAPGRPAGRRVRRGHPDSDPGAAQVGRGQAQPVTARDPGGDRLGGRGRHRDARAPRDAQRR